MVDLTTKKGTPRVREEKENHRGYVWKLIVSEIKELLLICDEDELIHQM